MLPFLVTVLSVVQDAGDKSFYWSNGAYLDYQHWNSGEPNNYYGSKGNLIISMLLANLYF